MEALSLYINEFYLLYTVFMLGAISPGPDAVMVTRNALCYGRKEGLFTAAGLGSGVFFHSTYILLGLGYIFHEVPMLKHVIKYAGSLYLAYLGVMALMTKKQSLDIDGTSESTRSHSALQCFRMGFMTNLLNAFAILYLISLLTLKVATETPAFIKLVYALILGCSYFAWNGFVSVIFSHSYIRARFLAFSHWIQRVSGLLLLYIALDFAMKKIG